MKLINNINSKIYQAIKAEGGNYHRRFHEMLAKENNLESHTLYKKLHPIPVEEGNYYLICVFNQKECYKIGYTQSPFDYWMDLLNKAENRIDSFSDVSILEKDLTLREAKRWHKYLKDNKAMVDRKIKILIAFKRIHISDFRNSLFSCRN